MRTPNERIEAVRRELLEKRGDLVKALLSPDGEALVSYLEEKFFNGDLMGDDALETAFNLGAREVVVQLRLVRALALRKPKEG